MENQNGKIMIEATEDKRLEVAMEVAKSLTNLTDLLKSMEVSISNIHINGCNIQTAQGETAIYMGNNVKNSLVTNSVFTTNYNEDNYEDDGYDDIDDETEEDDETYEESVSSFNYTENELKRKLEEFDKPVDTLYNIKHKVNNGIHTITAAQHWTWDFWAGEGDSLDEAIINMRSIVNMYDPKFLEIKKKYELE